MKKKEDNIGRIKDHVIIVLVLVAIWCRAPWASHCNGTKETQSTRVDLRNCVHFRYELTSIGLRSFMFDLRKLVEICETKEKNIDIFLFC